MSQNQSSEDAQVAAINVPKFDSVLEMVARIKEDTAGANLLGTASFAFAFYRPEKGVQLGQRGLQLSAKIGYRIGEALCNRSLAMCYWGTGNYSNGLQSGLNALHIYEELKDTEGIAFTYYVLANVYRDFGDYKRALSATKKGLEIYRQLNTNDIIGHAIMGSIYDLEGKIDSASMYVQKSVELNRKLNPQDWGWLNYLQGNIWRKKKQYDSALYYYKAALPLVEEKDVVETYNGIAALYRETGKLDSSIFYATEILEKWKSVAYQRGILQATTMLAEVYKAINNRDSTIKYLEQSVALNNKLYNQENERNIQNMAFEEQNRQNEILQEKERANNRLRLYLIFSVALALFVIVLVLWRNNQHRKRAFTTLKKQKEETDIQKAKADQTLDELKAAEAQLIQSEKMASLGELTAGIAHEIQNPLNFVNNFSEVNQELADELSAELATGNLQRAAEIINDIKENEDKINHHGKRADAIVKGMLQHSRTSSGQKEPTDINALVEEYLRLAYHGQRAKDKSFNAKFETDLDPATEKINVVSQDIGRVILNLINNAFYSVTEKRKQQPVDYEPTVSVRTRKLPGKIEISIKDNGNGIPAPVMEKMFQPFFTTKPTGQGTGLGLSLSYDIVTKGHGGLMKAESKEGEFAEFIIQLPT